MPQFESSATGEIRLRSTRQDAVNGNDIVTEPDPSVDGVSARPRLDIRDPQTSGQTVLLVPGPVMVDPSVRAAAALVPDMCAREPEVVGVIDSVRTRFTQIAGGGAQWGSVVFSGSGTAGVEATISSVIPRDGGLLAIINGRYGYRMLEIAKSYGIHCVPFESPWMKPADITALESVLKSDKRLTHVSLVHHETSTGVLNPIDAVAEVTHSLGRELIVDAIASLGAEDLNLEDGYVDWCVASSNKCLESLPGLALVAGKTTAFRNLESIPPRNLYLDLGGQWRAEESGNGAHFTIAVQVLYALDRALELALHEGVDSRSRRYQRTARRLRDGLVARGLQVLVREEYAASGVTHVALPDGLEYDVLHDALKSRGYVVYGADQELGRAFRIGTMGQLNDDHIDGFLEALDTTVRDNR